MSTAFYPLGMVSNSNRTNSECYVAQKGTGEYANPTSITSGTIRPLSNNDADTAIYNGIPRPMKHYRRGTFGQQTTGGRATIGQLIDRPGGFVQSTNHSCEMGGVPFVSSWSPIINQTEKPQTSQQSCIGSQVRKALTRARPASTIIKPNYYQTSAEHLYNRCATFDQAESHYRPDANADCGTRCANTTVYKPNNAKFGQQGAVSSSTRLLDLQQTALNKGAKSYEPKQPLCVPFRRKR